MEKQSKLEIARWAIDRVAPVVRAKGTHHPAGIDGPTHWRLDERGLTIIFTEQALLGVDDKSLSCLVDVWPTERPKVLSVSWEPTRPREPPRVIRCVEGPWRQELAALISTR